MIDFIMGVFVNNWAELLGFAVIGLICSFVFKRMTKDSSYPRVMFFAYLAFVMVIGWGLVLASALFNYTYTLELLSGMLGYEELAKTGAVFAVAVNLAGGMALQASARAYAKGKWFKCAGYVVGYLPIVAYSLLAANSVLLTGDATTRQKAKATELMQSASNSEIRAIRKKNKVLSSGANNAALRNVPSHMLNSNGARVSVATHCKEGNWYAKNQVACRDYLYAKKNSGAALAISNNQFEIVAIEKENARLEAEKVTPLQSSFFTLEVAPDVATMALALAVELAAIVSLVYVALDIGNPPTLPTPKNPKKLSRSTRSEDPKVQASDSSGLERSSGSVSNGAGDSEVKKGLQGSKRKDADHGTDSYYEGGTIAGNKVFQGQEIEVITDAQLEAFIYEIAVSNPHKPAVANQLISELRKQTGKGVGKAKVLEAIKSADCVLTKNNGSTNSYIFRAINNENIPDSMVSTVSPTQRLGARQ